LKDLDTERNIILKYVLEDITLVSVGYMYLAQNRGEWWAMVNIVINVCVKK
jgi:hypothetical protein